MASGSGSSLLLLSISVTASVYTVYDSNMARIDTDVVKMYDPPLKNFHTPTPSLQQHYKSVLKKHTHKQVNKEEKIKLTNKRITIATTKYCCVKSSTVILQDSRSLYMITVVFSTQHVSGKEFNIIKNLKIPYPTMMTQLNYSHIY